MPLATTRHPPRKGWEKSIRSYEEQRKTLWGICAKYSGEPALVGFMAGLIRRHKISGGDYTALARFIQAWVSEHIKFFREYPERFQSPMRTLRWSIGDCDDRSILIACTLRSFRVPVKLRFVRYLHPQTGKRHSHVYPMALLDGKWTALETVRKVPFGFDPLEKLRALGVKILSVEEIGDSHA